MKILFVSSEVDGYRIVQWSAKRIMLQSHNRESCEQAYKWVDLCELIDLRKENSTDRDWSQLFLSSDSYAGDLRVVQKDGVTWLQSVQADDWGTGEVWMNWCKLTPYVRKSYKKRDKKQVKDVLIGERKYPTGFCEQLTLSADGKKITYATHSPEDYVGFRVNTVFNVVGKLSVKE